ncbi:MAG: hypothetical protein ACLGI6_01700 [Gammaproteobacteria bacterium]
MNFSSRPHPRRPGLVAAGCALLVALLATAPALAQDLSATMPSVAHQSDLRELLVACNVYQWIATPGGTGVDQALRRQLTPEQVYSRVIPIYARWIGAPEAAQLAALSRSPVFRKREQRVLAAQGAAVPASSFLSQAEIAQLNRIDASPAMRALRAARPAINHDINDAFAPPGRLDYPAQ